MSDRIIRRQTQVEFDSNSDLIVVVMAGNINEFKYHLDDLIETYHEKARRIVYVYSNDQLYRCIAGQKKVAFLKVGNCRLSKINPDYWEAVKNQFKAGGRLEEL